MRIRIAATSPKNWTHSRVSFWNVKTIDEFEELFVRDEMLIINELRVVISNFVKHNKYIATFNVEHVEMEPELEGEGMCPYRYTHLLMLEALGKHKAPDGRRSFHNIKIAHIPDDYDPLKNPNAEYLRRAGQ